ncbi:hypothetical protein T484DRAFT_1855003, partial [Baffinella frigidus]
MRATKWAGAIWREKWGLVADPGSSSLAPAPAAPVEAKGGRRWGAAFPVTLRLRGAGEDEIAAASVPGEELYTMYGKVLHLVRDGGVPQKLVNVASDGAAAILWDRKEDPGEAGARLLRSLLRNCERVDEIPSMFLPPHLRPPEDPLECQMQEEEAPPPEAAAPVQEEVEVEEVEEVSPYVPGEDALARAGEARWDEEDEEEDEMMEK